MKFRLMSDIHLEIAKYKIPELDTDSETVLLLAGDISVGKGARNFIEKYLDNFKYIVYCLGNHEFYNREYYDLIEDWSKVELEKFHFLHNNSIIIDDIKILGGTLWTDFKKKDEYSMNKALLNMNDYRRIKIDKRDEYKERKITPKDTVDFHNETVDFISKELANKWDGKKLIMTHHAPSEVGLNPIHNMAFDKLNPAYYSNLEHLMLEYDVDVWVHGHTHYSHETVLGKTRIISNCRGYYPYESMNETLFQPTRVFEL